MSSSCSIGCLFVLIACLVFLGAAARRSLSGQDWFLPPTLGNFSMRDAIEKAWTGPYLREFQKPRNFGITQVFVFPEHQKFAPRRIQVFHGLSGPEHGLGGS